MVGTENWSFVVTDDAGRANECSFIVTTINQTSYIPNFYPTYLVVNYGGADLLDFYISCVSDDWEMNQIIVTYPGGLGGDTYIGNGQIITMGNQFTFSNYFLNLGGTWAFSFSGIVKSGIHINESFTSICSVSVSGK